MKELVNYVERTKVDWKIISTPNLLNFAFHTRLYINNFNFASNDGLDNFKSNLFTLLNEAKKELSSRNIEFDY